MASRGLGIAVLAVLGLWAWSQAKAKAAPAAPVPTEKTAAQRAKAMVEDPTMAVEQLSSYASRHPSAAGQIEQATQQLASGQVSADDPGLRIFIAQMEAYDQYVADGGTLTFDDFSTMSGTRMKSEIPNGEKYWAIIAEAKGETIAEPLVQPTAEAVVVPEEQFTASSKQLATLEKQVSEEEYQATIDVAYETAKAEAESSGADSVVTWSSSGGYQAVSEQEAKETLGKWYYT